MSNFLEDCEKNPIHISGKIQPHGAIAVIDKNHNIIYISENISEYLLDDNTLSLGKSLAKKFLPFIKTLESETLSRLRTQIKNINLSFVKNNNSEIIIEFTKSTDSFRPSEEILEEIETFEQIKNESELNKLREKLISDVFHLSGYKRIMYYSFFEDGDGEVLNEIKDSTVHGSYMGLRFPASDIPMIARQLYLLNPWRQIPDVNAKPINILGSSNTPPDLTYSDLRSVPEVHLAYLKNMQVFSSASFPISIGGELKGLIACHDYKPNTISVATLEKISARIKSFNFAYSNYFAANKILAIDDLNFKINSAKLILKKDIFFLTDWFLKEFSADGVTILDDTKKANKGVVLNDAYLKTIDNWFLSKQNPTLSIEKKTKELQFIFLTEISGFLSIRMSSKKLGKVRIYIFRKELIQEIIWAGNPEKPHDDSAFGIAPRDRKSVV